MWAELFGPGGRIFGFDRDLSSYLNNRVAMRRAGFSSERQSRVVTTPMEQMANNTALLREVLGAPAAVDFAMDDGCHTPEAGARTFVALLPHLAPRFAYIIEDMRLLPSADGSLPSPRDRGSPSAAVRRAVGAACPECTYSVSCPSGSPPDSDRRASRCRRAQHKLHPLGLLPDQRSSCEPPPKECLACITRGLPASAHAVGADELSEGVAFVLAGAAPLVEP